jgi:hypothetical protein
MASAVPFQKRPAPLPVDLSKKLPNNLDAERSVLGAILLDNKSLLEVAGYLHADEFFLDQHRRTFSAMLELAKIEVGTGRTLGSSIDLITLTEKLETEGQLEAAGGAPYLASLADGMPRTSNIKHYAAIVIEKAKLRRLIHATHHIQMRAFEGMDSSDLILTNAEEQIKEIGTSTAAKENPMVVVGCRELLTLEMPPPEFLIEPLLTRGGTMLIYAWAGIGKSYITTEFAAHLAMGLPKMFCDHLGRGGLWPISRACRVLYLYGEMHGGEIKERFKEIAKGHRLEIPEDSQLGFVAKEFQLIKRASNAARQWRPRIDSAADRRIVEDNLAAGAYEVLVLDNISTLWSASLDDASDREAILKNWFIDLNARGISIIALTHAGKSGDFLGDSQQIHILDSLLKLRRPANYKMEEQLRAEMKIEKLRHKAMDSRLTRDFEVQLDTTDPALGAVWTMRAARKAQIQASFEMFRDDMKAAEVAKELAISPRTVYRYKKMYLENSDAKHWTDRESE